jgi:GTPase involved in cell partitioning and DNA repair
MPGREGDRTLVLRHLERTNLLLHILAPDVSNGEELTMDSLVKQLVNDYNVVRKELVKYDKGLPEKEGTSCCE